MAMQFHTALLYLYLADPATFLASFGVLGTRFSSENSLFIQLWQNKNVRVCVIKSSVL